MHEMSSAVIRPKSSGPAAATTDNATVVISDAGWPDVVTPCAIFGFSLSFVLLGLTCIIGFIGNSLSIVTFAKHRGMRQSVTELLLTALAVADLAFLVPVVVVIMPPAYCALRTCAPTVRMVILHVERYGWSLASAGHMSTVYMTILVALHRYVHVCRPHEVQRLSGLKRVKIQIALVPCFALAYSLPRMLEYETREMAANTSGAVFVPAPDEFGLEHLMASGVSDIEDVSVTRGRMVLTEIGQSMWFQILYKNICFYLFMVFIPLSSLVFVSFRLIGTLRMRQKNSRRLAVARQKQSRDDKVTTVLVIVIVVFIVCQTPTAAQRLTLTLSGTDGLGCGRIYFYVEKMADYLAVLNSCVNFVIYVLFSRHFRRILLTEVLHACVRLAAKRRVARRSTPDVAGKGRVVVSDRIRLKGEQDTELELA